jgi:hypothetical protein
MVEKIILSVLLIVILSHLLINDRVRGWFFRRWK